MPNHVTNKLIISGPADALSKLEQQVKVPDTDDAENAFSFNQVIPMPEVFRDLSAGTMLSFALWLASEHIYQTTVEQDPAVVAVRAMFRSDSTEMFERFCMYFKCKCETRQEVVEWAKVNQPELLAMGMRPISNIVDATNYVLFDATTHQTGIPWSNTAKTGTFEMVTTLDYRLTINGQSFEGTFADASEYAVDYIRFWNWNAGDTDERTFFIGALSVTGAPLPVLTYAAETAVTRAASTNPTCHVQGLTLVSGGGLAATVTSLDGIADNVWQADALTNGAWNWTLLPDYEYELVPSNNTIVLTPAATNGLKLFSIGKPGL